MDGVIGKIQLLPAEWACTPGDHTGGVRELHRVDILAISKRRRAEPGRSSFCRAFDFPRIFERRSQRFVDPNRLTGGYCLLDLFQMLAPVHALDHHAVYLCA